MYLFLESWTLHAIFRTIHVGLVEPFSAGGQLRLFFGCIPPSLSTLLNPGSFGKFSKYIYLWNLQPYMLFSVRSTLGWSNLLLLEDNCAFFWAAFLFTTELWHAKKKPRCLLVTTVGSEVSSTKKCFSCYIALSVMERSMRLDRQRKVVVWVYSLFRWRITAKILWAWSKVSDVWRSRSPWVSAHEQNWNVEMCAEIWFEGHIHDKYANRL